MPKQKQTSQLRFVLTVVSAITAVFVLVGIFLAVRPAQAATGINEQVNFQGRLLDATGAVVADGSYNMKFRVYQDGNGVLGGGDETLKWTEARESGNKVLVKNGYFSVYLGSVTAFASNVDWNQDTLWLSIDIGGTGTPTYDGEMSPFTRLSSSPYALNSGRLGGLAATEFVKLAQGVQTDSSTSNPSIYVNKTGSTANILQLQKSGSDVFVVDNTGKIVFGGDTLSDFSGNGLVVSSNILTLNLTTSGTTGSTSSNSGLEVGSVGLTLLKGCAHNEILKWGDSGSGGTDTWACAADTGGGGNSFETINAPAGTDPVADSATDTLNLTVTGTNLTITGTAGTDTLDFDISESTLAGTGLGVSGDGLVVNVASGITTSGDNVVLDVDFAPTWTNAHTWTLAGTEDLDATSDLAGTVDILNLTGTPSGTAGTAYGLYIDQADSANSNGFDASLVIDNSDANLAIADGILFVSAGGGFTDFIDTPSSVFKVDGTGIVTAANIICSSTSCISTGEITDATITGDDVAPSVAGAGLVLTAGSPDALDIASGNGGIVVNADNIALTLAASADALSSTTSNGSGLEALSQGLTLLQGCTDAQILKWTESSDTWGCAADSTGGASADLDGVYDNDTDKVLAVDSTTGLLFNMTTTGDFILQDNGSTFLTVDDTGGIAYTMDGTDNPAFTITNSGSSNITINLAGTGDFVIQDNGTVSFTVDDSGNVYVGNPTADGTGALLVLDTKNTSGDPTGTNGAMYYNSNSNKFRCYEAGAWKDCDTTGGSSAITRVAGSSGAAGSDITLQRLTSNTADVTTTSLSSSVMSTTSVGAGTWKFKYTLFYQTAATTTGIAFGVNHTGASSSLKQAIWYHITTGGAAATGIGDNVAGTAAGQLTEGKSGATINAIIGSATAGVATANANITAILEGVVVVTNSGSLELKIASEVSGSAVRLISGSMLELIAY